MAKTMKLSTVVGIDVVLRNKAIIVIVGRLPHIFCTSSSEKMILCSRCKIPLLKLIASQRCCWWLIAISIAAAATTTMPPFHWIHFLSILIYRKMNTKTSNTHTYNSIVCATHPHTRRFLLESIVLDLSAHIHMCMGMGMTRASKNRNNRARVVLT